MKKILMTALLSTSVFASSSFATPINNGAGLASPAETITFSEIALPNSTAMNSQYASLGLASVSGLYYNGCEGGCVTTPPSGAHPELSNFAHADFNGTAVSDILFGAAQSAVSFQFASNRGTFTLTSLLNGQTVESFQFNGSTWGIYGFQSSVFNELKINSPNAFLLDNLQLSNVSAVPEPASLALMGLGLVGVAAMRRRKQ